ncbi:hypothetical protein BDN72DRAFT_883476 [Pluteus cervinus]|uniref:Uncharacterized protein n=1 Tax=Pluteus cervinus TaxID=181527 RepID=A0ACD3A4W9_9AGAR|nr:hypothetical protein BDN72DRAFT_883476 [Pluteus cervinus]
MDPLAPELLDLIFKHVMNDFDPRELADALTTFSLVSREWREIAQPILLSRYPRSRHHRNKELFITLSEQPHLQRHVKNLWIQTKALDSVPLYESVFRELAPGRNTLIITNEFCGLFPKHIFATISHCLLAGHLTKLYLSDLNGFPINIFYSLPSLRELHLHASTLLVIPPSQSSGLSYSPSWTRAPKAELIHLFIEGASTEQMNILTWFMGSECAFNISRLKTFHTLEAVKSSSTDTSTYTMCQEFIKRVSSSLRDLALDPNPGVLLVPDSFTFESLPKVRSVKLSLQNDHFPSTNFLPWAADALEHLVYAEVLEYVELPCRLSGDEAITLDPSFGWHRLDDVLASSRFPNLKSVIFGFVGVTSCEREGMGVIGDAIPSLLPRLSDKGILTVEISPGKIRLDQIPLRSKLMKPFRGQANLQLSYPRTGCTVGPHRRLFLREIWEHNLDERRLSLSWGVRYSLLVGVLGIQISQFLNGVFVAPWLVTLARSKPPSPPDSLSKVHGTRGLTIVKKEVYDGRKVASLLRGNPYLFAISAVYCSVR